MADKYIIKVNPKVDRSDGKKMEKDLNRRFARVSKKFGKNLTGALKSSGKAGLIGIAAGIAGIVLANPFEKINSDLDAFLAKFDNTATRAAQFGVSAGKYFEAEKTLESTGVKNFDAVLARFSTTLAKAIPRDDGTTEDPYLQEFLGAKDDIDAFYAFAKRISTLSPTERNNAAETVFGEKIGLKIAEALQTNLAKQRDKIFRGQTREDLTRKINSAGVMEGEQSIFRAKLAVDELNQKSGSITSQTVKNQNQIEKMQLARESNQLREYNTFAELKAIQERAALAAEGIRADLTSTLTPILHILSNTLTNIYDFIKKFKFSKIF
tara:strand:- start:3550 stop:4521 length:972 start_codon:yes stop_codon:yes gene_type:complete